jgi:hypothetical protein
MGLQIVVEGHGGNIWGGKAAYWPIQVLKAMFGDEGTDLAANPTREIVFVHN